MDGQPAVRKVVGVRGTGFAADTDIQFRIDNLDKGTSFTFNGPGEVRNTDYHTGADGSFATTYQADFGDLGRERFTASDGTCGISIDATVADQ
jgi:hypothetical protein